MARKLKMTEDFKRASKGMALYVVVAIVFFPVYHAIKGDFTWGDTLVNAAIHVGLGLVLALFFFLGFQIPENDG